jgi:RHS repeat-associated protein
MKSFYRLLFIAIFLSTTTLSSVAQVPPPPDPSCPCGNSKKGPDDPTCPSCGPNHFDPFTGNVSRDIRDLEIWGGVGEIPLVLMRYGNSRNMVRPWQLAFHYLLFDGGTNAAGQPILELHYPQGGRDIFAQSPINPTWWLPISGINERIYQYGNNFFLQLANGHRYRFEKMVTGGNTDYVLRDFKDQYQNEYTVTYDNVNLKKRITEPAGRYLEFQFTPRSFVNDPLSAATSDGRHADYVYDTFNDGIRDHVRLRTVNYGDGTKAQYDYSQQAPGIPFVLSHAIDPRVEGHATNMRYTYTNIGGGIAGIVYQEINGVSNEVMATLDGSTVNRKVSYPTGRIQVINMPDSMMGEMKTYRDGVNATTEYTYYDNGKGFVKTITDALGRVTTFNAYTIYGNPLEITHPDGSKEKWIRDTLDLVLRYYDQLNRATTYTRDSRHRPTRIDYPDGRYETFTYNGFSEVLDHRRKNGCTEHFTYDSRGLESSFTDCAGNLTQYAYDPADRLATTTDARGNVTRYEYNERGLVTKMTNADNSTRLYTYDAFGNRLTTTNEVSKTWTTTYDEFKRPKTIADPLSRTTNYSYDLPGGVCGCSHEKANPTKITLPSGRATTMTYDVEWRKTGKAVGEGTPDAATTQYEYDLIGNLVRTIDGRGKQWATTYDNMNRRKSRADPLGNTTEWTYDLVGNTLTVKRPDGGTTVSVYDRMDRVVQTTDPKGQATKYVYDDDGNVMKFTDPKGNAYVFGHDVLDRLTYMRYTDNLTSEGYTYDAVGNLKTFRNRKGDVRTYTYDNRDREILSDWSDATPDVATTYDAAGRAVTKTSSVSALSYAYNGANELLSETQNVGGGGGPKTVSYAYNQDGWRSAMTYPAGTVLSYNYTGRNLLRTIGENTGLSPTVVTYTYDLTDDRAGKALQNGTSTAYAYDDARRLLSIDHQKGAASFARFNYGYDNVNRRTFVQYDNTKGDVYSYDAIDQVTDVKYDVTNPDGVAGTPIRAVNYNYDAAGNRTTLTNNGTITNYATNNLNQYTTVGASPLAYSADGNLQTADGWTYTYDAQNRLISAQKAATTVDFLYDAMNRCVKRVVNAATTFFHYDGWNLIEERNAAGVLLQRYVHGVMTDELLKKVSSANTVYYHQDALGSVTHLTSETGNVVEKYAYDVFGAATIKDAGGAIIQQSAFENRFMFTGRELIKEINLYDYRNRMYLISQGRFVQPDLIKFADWDLNLYKYVGNNSINKTDPLGLEAQGPGEEDCTNRCRKFCEKAPFPNKCFEKCWDACMGGKPNPLCFLETPGNKPKKLPWPLSLFF